MLRTEISRAGRRQWDTENPGVPHPLDVAARLDELREMQDGWADGMQIASDWGSGYGKAPDHAGLDWLAGAFERHYPDDLPLPHIFPTTEGGVEAEWTLGGHSIIFEIDLGARQGDWLRFHKDDENDEDSEILNLDYASAWDWFAAEVRRLAESETAA